MRTRHLLRSVAGALAIATLAACDGDSGGQPFANCGNGSVDAPETCDLGAANSDSGECLTTCVRAVCGDGFVWAGVEECDTNNLAGRDCTQLGYGTGRLQCAACRFDFTQCGPPLPPTATPSASPTPTSTPTATVTPSGPTPTPEPCRPGAETQTVHVSYQPPGPSAATSVRIALNYPERVLSLPPTGVTDRVSPLQPRTVITQVANADNTLRAQARCQGCTTLAPGPLLAVTFDRCTGAPPPTDGDFACVVEDCKPGLSGCTCTATVR